MDLPSLALPYYKLDGKDVDQNAIVAAVAKANPHTVVVLETGSPALMPWVKEPAAILEAWYGGSDGADALGNVLFGTVNPSGKLPNTFPLSDADLPHLKIVKPPVNRDYDEGVKVGYKWYDAEQKPVLFPFGYGLSYTTFGYSGLKVDSGDMVKVTFTLANNGARAGKEIAEVYAALPASAEEPPKRLVGWSKVELRPGERKPVTVEVERKYLSIWDVDKHDWTLVPGDYTFMVGGSSDKLPLKATLTLK